MGKNGNSLRFYKAILIVLVMSLSITGISYLDNKVWNTVMMVIGMLTYSVVGLFFSIGLIRGKNAGKEAYAFVFIILIILGYCVYSGIIAIQNWIINWPLYVKILALSLYFIAIIIVIIRLLIKKRS